MAPRLEQTATLILRAEEGSIAQLLRFSRHAPKRARDTPRIRMRAWERLASLRACAFIQKHVKQKGDAVYFFYRL